MVKNPVVRDLLPRVRRFLRLEPLLPVEPSELLRLAAKDLRAVARNPRYLVDMRGWHIPVVRKSGNQVRPLCKVCLAGAVIAGTLKARPNTLTEPSQFKPATMSLLVALDSARRGEWLGFTGAVNRARDRVRRPQINPARADYVDSEVVRRGYTYMNKSHLLKLAGELTPEESEELARELEARADLWAEMGY